MIISFNVIGILEGSDLIFKNEFIVLIVYSDYIGVSGYFVLKDKINNGVMDNVSGVFILFEIVYVISYFDVKLKCLVIFVIVMGEEKGLLGFEYFVYYLLVLV